MTATRSAADQEIFKILRSERRWAIVERAFLWTFRICAVAFVLAAIAGAVIVELDYRASQISDARGVMDGE